MLKKSSSYLVLYGSHALKVFSFVILIPHFTRIFPKQLWGNIIMIQAIGLWLQILIEYGFNLSATRSMARVRNDDEEISRLVSGVLGAKALLSVSAIILSILTAIFFPKFTGMNGILFYATLFAIIQGFNPIWYFMARERFAQYASIDFLSRLIYLLGCLVIIKNSSQGNMIFIIGILTGILANTLGYWIIYRKINFIFPSLNDCLFSLREGFGMFVFVGITSIYTTLNVVILGISQDASIVAAYGTSDKIVRAAGGMLDPINRVVYSKLSFLYKDNFIKAVDFLRKAALGILMVGSLIFICGELLAPFIIRILAPNYPEAIHFLRILLIFIPILALNNIVGLHIMLPLGMDKKFNTVFIITSLISVILMYFFIPLRGADALAAITIFTELAALIGMGIFIVQGNVLSKNNTLEA